MKNIKNIFCAGMLAFSIISFTACDDKEDTYDFPGDSYNRVYMLDQSGSYKIVQTPISTVSNLNFEASLKCTQKASSSIRATVEIDNSMIAAYNEKHGTKYEAIPANALVIENATVNIPANEMASSDTLRISMTKDESILTSLRSENGYLIPLRLAKAEGGDSQPSSNFFTSYLIVTITEDNINHDAVVSDITGTLVADQTGWSATTNGSISSWGYPIETMFDGDMSSSCSISSNGGDINLDVNMGKSYTFDAITLYYGYSYPGWGTYEYGQLTNGMTIYTSKDGASWQSVGEITGSDSKFCVFHAPVTAQYIRFVKPNNDSYMSIEAGIFNIYAK